MPKSFSITDYNKMASPVFKSHHKSRWCAIYTMLPVLFFYTDCACQPGAIYFNIKLVELATDSAKNPYRAPSPYDQCHYLIRKKASQLPDPFYNINQPQLQQISMKKTLLESSYQQKPANQCVMVKEVRRNESILTTRRIRLRKPTIEIDSLMIAYNSTDSETCFTNALEIVQTLLQSFDNKSCSLDPTQFAIFYNNCRKVEFINEKNYLQNIQAKSIDRILVLLNGNHLNYDGNKIGIINIIKKKQ